MHTEFPALFHILSLLDSYYPEANPVVDYEALFVFMLDKILPSFVHSNTGVLNEFGIFSESDLRKSVQSTDIRLEPFKDIFPELFKLRELGFKRIGALLAASSDTL